MMKCRKWLFLWLACLVMSLTGTVDTVLGQEAGMIRIEDGVYVPLYGEVGQEVKVAGFNLDIYPVTNEEYLEFVQVRENWQKDKVIRLYADEAYLSHWSSPLGLGNATPQAAVTNVSWFAAKAYCEWKGKRLPTLDEWEFAAMAGEDLTDARSSEKYNQYILSWYETSKTHLLPVGSGMKNVYGVFDLHGLVWEWTYDFSSVLLSSESRQGGNIDNNLFCGSSAIGATDLMNYAAFMRYAFRASMKARYTSRNLGFRCAKDLKDNPQ